MIIAFEGLNGSGKTTIIDMVFEHLLQNKRNKLQLHKEPSGIFGSKRTDISSRVRALLYCAERAHTVEKLLEKIPSDTILLFDRFVDSTTAYQIGGDGLNNRTIEEITHYATRGIRPSLTIYLKLSPEVAKERSDTQLEEPYLKRVETVYNYLSTIYKDYVVIDASRSKDEVFKDVLTAIEKVLP